MRTIEREVFNINELDDKAKNRAFERWVGQCDMDYDCIIDSLTERLEDIGVYEPKIRFSGFGSQGDGASFTGRLQDVGKFLDRELNRHENFVIENSDIFFRAINSRYSHENTVNTIIDINYKFDCDEQMDKMESIAIDLEKEIEDKRYSLCRKIYNDLEYEYQYQTSQESFFEACESNEYEFYANGDMI